MLKHWIWLTTREGIGTRGCAALLRLYGSAEEIYARDESAYRKTEGFERRWLRSLSDKSLAGAWLDRSDADYLLPQSSALRRRINKMK